MYYKISHLSEFQWQRKFKLNSKNFRWPEALPGCKTYSSLTKALFVVSWFLFLLTRNWTQQKDRATQENNRFLKWNSSDYTLGRAFVFLRMPAKGGTDCFVCSPYLQHTTPTGNCKYMKTKANFPASCQLTSCLDSKRQQWLTCSPRTPPGGAAKTHSAGAFWSWTTGSGFSSLSESSPPGAAKDRKRSGVGINAAGFLGQKEKL